MDLLQVSGGRPLVGTVRVDGAKNSALPIMAATLAIGDMVELRSIPDLVDVRTMRSLLLSQNADVSSLQDGCLRIHAGRAGGKVAHYDLVRQMRAGICVLGPLLTRFGRACVSLPGGCNIGHRPVDLHLKALVAMGADVRIENGYIVAECERLQGAQIDLEGPFGSTVTGTCNVMVAATLARGRTVIQNAALEPEVTDLAAFLQRAGAVIHGHGTSVIEIEGQEELSGCSYTVMPDRIEAATLAVAAVTTRGEICISNAPVSSMQATLDVLSQVGACIDESTSGLRVSGTGQLRATRFVARPFPGVPTDCQAQLMALLTTVEGQSEVADAVFPERFMHVSELMRMGAQIVQQHGEATIYGGRPLGGADVMASDLRASAALVIAALAASGTTWIQRIYHLDRGYVRLEDKLRGLGADVHRVSQSELRTPHYLMSDHRNRPSINEKGSGAATDQTPE
ncbi:MAG: UDP-N-acetylglucosamine 1-carboxyvinyltransferase [Planctomycetaceae bacterium]|nr:UDP-N-acetylglucosamine 1-carboxyvinyltransferase [Planctomycetaceae bacterium]